MTGLYPREKMMCIVGFSLLYILSYVRAKTDSIYLLAVCSVVMGFLRMVLMMVNLFTLIKYAFKMEATRNITPGNEPVMVKDGISWTVKIVPVCLPFICFS